MDKKSELSVLVDSATGGASIKDGQVEIMLHRRMLVDSGIGEALAESVCVGDECEGPTVRGNYYLSINQLVAGARWRQTTGQEVYSPILLSFTHEIKEVEEISLSTNQEKSEMKKLTWKIEGNDEQKASPVRGGPVDGSNLVVELGPMEIRTFLLKF